MGGLILKDVKYKYPKSKYQVLNGISEKFKLGTVTSICGKSGSGKSTLLYLIAGLESPTSGELIWENKPIIDLSEYRRKIVGLISQSYLLFPTRTALENVCYPLLLKENFNKNFEVAKRLLKSVGIGEELHNRLPEKLSGGEQQRVAIARCLAADSKIIAADEPTGNLDKENADLIMDILINTAHNEGKAVIIVTHDNDLAERADVQKYLEFGELRDL